MKKTILIALLVPALTMADRARDLGIPFEGTPGEYNAITDVDGVTWEVWFATDQAIDAKFALARRLGIGGVAIWRLGGDPASFWDVIRRYR